MQIRGFWAWAVLVTLFVSLGVNFFLGGFLFERLRRGFAGPPIVRVLQDFPPPVRRAIARELWHERRRFFDTVAEIQDKREAIAQAMRAPVIDRARIGTLMAEVRVLTSRLQERAQDAVLDAIERIPAEERAQIGTGPRFRLRGPPPGLDDREETPAPAR